MKPANSNKQEIARRLALIARAQVYGETLEYSGPVVDTVTFDGKEVRLTFTHAEGLCFRDGKALGFEIAGADDVYHAATGVIQGNTVIISAPAVAIPAAVRYAWRDTPDVSLLRYLVVDCFSGKRPKLEPTWDEHVRVMCRERGWDYEQARRPLGWAKTGG